MSLFYLLPGLRKREDLKRKGLNPDAFKTIHYPPPWKLEEKIDTHCFYRLLKKQKGRGSLNMSSLKKMFLRTDDAKE